MGFKRGALTCLRSGLQRPRAFDRRKGGKMDTKPPEFFGLGRLGLMRKEKTMVNRKEADDDSLGLEGI